MLQSIAAIPGAVFTGWIYDQTESYTYALIPFMLAYTAAGIVIWRLPRATRKAGVGVPARGAIDVQS